MIIHAPTLDREEEATAENIAEIVRRLKGKDKPFAILRKTNMTFIQILWTSEGYILAYQENDIEHIYRAKELVSQKDTIWAFSHISREKSAGSRNLNLNIKQSTILLLRLVIHLELLQGRSYNL